MLITFIYAYRISIVILYALKGMRKCESSLFKYKVRNQHSLALIGKDHKNNMYVCIYNLL